LNRGQHDIKTFTSGTTSKPKRLTRTVFLRMRETFATFRFLTSPALPSDAVEDLFATLSIH